MTFGFTNIQIYTADRPTTEVRAALIDTIRQTLYEHQFVDAADNAEADRVIFIAPAGPHPWISVYDETIGDADSTEDLEDALRQLSARLSTSAVGLSLSNHVLRLLFYRNGDLVDRFYSEQEFDHRTPLAAYVDVQGHAERWQHLLAPGARADDLRDVWNQENLDQPEGIEDLARVLTMHEYQARADWVDVEAGDIDEDIFTADAQVTILFFKLTTPPFYRSRSDAQPAFAALGGGVDYTFTAGKELHQNGVSLLHTSFRSIGRASRGLRVVLWGSALDHGLIDPQRAQLLPPHSPYQSPCEPPSTELPFIQDEQTNGRTVYQITAADFEIPAGIANWTMGGGVPRGLSWHRAYDAARLTHIGISLFGQATAAGKGELVIGMMPLETLEQSMAVWRIAIEVVEPSGG